MTDLHLSFQSLATLHALPQILDRLLQSPQAREGKSFSKNVLSMFNAFPGMRPNIRLPRWYKNLPECPVECGGGPIAIWAMPKCRARQLKRVFPKLACSWWLSFFERTPHLVHTEVHSLIGPFFRLQYMTLGFGVDTV